MNFQSGISSKKGFIAKELRSLLELMALMAIALGYIIFYVKITPAAFLLIPLIAIAFILRMSASAPGKPEPEAVPEPTSSHPRRSG
ncbi:MAG: hypothetical protein NC319_01345 [Butyricicoccus sp.]|nr:hypothetical protein [Butyricicoccus sp.]